MLKECPRPSRGHSFPIIKGNTEIQTVTLHIDRTAQLLFIADTDGWHLGIRRTGSQSGQSEHRHRADQPLVAKEYQCRFFQHKIDGRQSNPKTGTE